jgi:hypothetical protein
MTLYATLSRSYEYGPCVGVTRLERWERAAALGLSPPVEVLCRLNVNCSRLHADFHSPPIGAGNSDDQRRERRLGANTKRPLW